MLRRSARLTSLVALSMSTLVLAVGPASVTAVPAPPDTGAAASAPVTWKLVHTESFSSLGGVAKAAWVRDPQGAGSPWNVDHLDDDGAFFDIQGGEDFRRHLQAAGIVRKRAVFGTNGWLTVELAARDGNADGRPDSAPSLGTVKVAGQSAGRLSAPTHDSGVIVRNTQALPARYRIEYTLRTLDFGGKRNGSWFEGGAVNGYAGAGCKTSWPWKRAGSFAGSADPCNANFGDVRAENGFYFLTIVDYDRPAPHNNVFIHHHRKVGMDMYNVNASWSQSYAVCNPGTRTTEEYADSATRAVNAIFFDGSRLRSPEIGYQQLLMPTECGAYDGSDPDASLVSAAEIVPELLPAQSYRFAIERDATGYTMEMSGPFRHTGQATFRYHRDFVQDGRPIWHYNQTAAEYDGAFDSTLTFSGPYGSYTRQLWPAGSAYPDYFVIGDPHLNYYEGSATIDDLSLYVPKR